MRTHPTNTPQTRRDFIEALPRHGIVAEIGVQRGDLSQTILELCAPASLYLVDCWAYQADASYQADPANVSQASHNRNYDFVKEKFRQYPSVTILREYSQDAAERFLDNTFDWVYIDARHTYSEVLDDIEAWWRRIKPGGYLAGHDYLTKQPYIQTKDAVDEFLRITGNSLCLLDNEPFPSWAVRKPPPSSSCVAIAGLASGSQACIRVEASSRSGRKVLLKCHFERNSSGRVVASFCHWDCNGSPILAEHARFLATVMCGMSIRSLRSVCVPRLRWRLGVSHLDRESVELLDEAIKGLLLCI